MRYLIIALLLSLNSFALTPFSLEGFTEANVKVFAKSKYISKELKQKITKSLKQELKKLNIKTKSDNFSNLILKIEVAKVDKTFVVNMNLFIVEDIIPSRNKTLENMGITYKKSDFFDTTNLETDLYESAIDYLLFDFIEQYKEENN